MVDVDGRSVRVRVRVMLKEAWNPALPDRAATLAYLNRCFDGGWDETLYRWYLARPFKGRTPDRIVISDAGEPVAGSVVNYRQLLAADGSTVDIGIASGSWTVPEARGRGLFTRMMQASTSRAGEQGCRYFLAFVTEDNASRKALERCGATMIPSVYVVNGDSPNTSGTAGSVERVDASRAEMYGPSGGAGTVRFYYDSAAAWTAQHLERPLPVHVYRLHDEYAIVEKTGDTDRLQWTSAHPERRIRVATSLAVRAAASGRKFFMYATGRAAREAAGIDGLVTRPGFVCCLPTGPGCEDPLTDLGRDWDIQSGDRL